MKASYELKGVRGLQLALENASEQMTKRVSTAMERTAKLVQAEARRLVPKDEHDLERAIQIAGKKLSWRVGLDDAPVTSRGGSSAHQHPSVYGIWYEFGFTKKNIDAKPYMGPASQSQERAHVERTEDAINAALKEID